MGCKVVRIGDIAAINANQYSVREAWQHIQYLDTGNVTRGCISSLQQLDPSSDKVPSRARRKVKPNSIVYSMVRPNQEHYAILDNPPEDMLVSTGFAVIDADCRVVSPGYLYYALTTKTTTDYFQALAEQSVSTYPTLSASDLESYAIPLPSIDRQKQIEKALNDLDAKIALNTKLNGYLEELALALYTEHLEWSDGELPVGWVRRPLSDFFPVKTGKKDANIATENGLFPFFTCGKQNLFTDNYSFDGSAILVAGNGDFSVKWYEGKFEAYQRTYVLMPNDPALLGYLYCAVKRNLSNITSKSRGSVIKFITKGNIADYEIAVPPIPEMNEIIKYLNQILRAIDANKRDTALLKELRDVLLPKLMSGEIDVTKVDLMQLNSHLA